MEKTMEKIVALAKNRGFVYPGSEIYGGLANTWDYGNLGVELKNNVKKAWWHPHGAGWTHGRARAVPAQSVPEWRLLASGYQAAGLPRT